MAGLCVSLRLLGLLRSKVFEKMDHCRPRGLTDVCSIGVSQPHASMRNALLHVLTMSLLCSSLDRTGRAPLRMESRLLLR